MKYKRGIVKFLSPICLEISQKMPNFAAVIELQRHIEILLLENECVIVPDFGGFITHYVPSHYDEEDRLFLPPYLTLGFNPQLKINDSLLAQSYAEALDISLPEAMNRIEKEVKELKSILSEEGQYTLENVGTLIVNQDSNYEFTPCEAGILSPEMYGLGSFSFKQLKDQKQPQILLETSEEAQMQSDALQQDPQASTEEVSNDGNSPALIDFTDNEDDHNAVEIKISWIRNAIAIAAAIVAFFMLSTPIANSNWGTKTMSQLQSGLLFRLIPQDTNYTPSISTPAISTPIAENAENAKPTEAMSESKKESPSAQRSQSSQEKEKTKEVSEKQKPVCSTYCIVLASQVKLSNAEQFVSDLHRQGYDKAAVLVQNNVVRVICGEYETEAEAYKHLNSLYSNPEFSEAWVYKKKAEV